MDAAAVNMAEWKRKINIAVTMMGSGTTTVLKTRRRKRCNHRVSSHQEFQPDKVSSVGERSEGIELRKRVLYII